METVVFKLLFIGSVTAQIGKHVFVSQPRFWTDAQKYCRDHYTDLSPITSQWEEERLKNATSGELATWIWIGLYLDGQEWRWSGGRPAKNIPWHRGQPNKLLNQPYVCVCWKGCNWNRWHNTYKAVKLPFLCYNLIVVESLVTWDEAMWHCSQKNISLTSLVSDTEHGLALRKIGDGSITDGVWIGLRFLGDRWLWVDGNPLEYQAWTVGDQDDQCPLWKRCGALTKYGLWEKRDCQEKLNFICS